MIYTQDNMIFDPAYIEAYLLEKYHAVNPVIILSDRIINELELKCLSKRPTH